MRTAERTSTLFPMFDTCPGCGSQGLAPVSTRFGLAFRCPVCARCWQVAMGYVSEVDAVTGRYVAHQRTASG